MGGTFVYPRGRKFRCRSSDADVKIFAGCADRLKDVLPVRRRFCIRAGFRTPIVTITCLEARRWTNRLSECGESYIEIDLDVSIQV
jgi:hypothetical protein